VPRSKPSRCEELRITLGTKERMMVEELLTSYRISAVCGNDSIVETFGDFGKVLAVAGTLGGLLELLGITDVFDFDDEVKGLVLPTKAKLADLREKAPPLGPLGDLLKEALRPFQG
jgi:hypothetical protein